MLVYRNVFWKYQINLNTVRGAIHDLPWRNIWLADNPVGLFNEHLTLLVGRYVLTKGISVSNNWISLGLMINAGML